jgi:alcohol dehydrogenase class IV
VAHALGHALGTTARVPHGRAVALALRMALACNVAADPGCFRAAAHAMGLGPPIAWAAGFDEFLLAVGTEVSLASDGLAEDDAERLAEITMAPENRPMLENNARPVGAAEVAKLARALLTAS